MSCDLRTPGWLPRHLSVAILMILVGGLLFAAMAYELQTHGPLINYDVSLAARMHSLALHAGPGVDEIMTFGFFLGKEVIELIGAILIVYFLYKRFWAEVGMIILGWSGAAGLWLILTSYFHRVRPADQIGIPVHYPSFPSGHTTQAVLCFGLLAYLLIPRMPSMFWKWVIAIAAILTVLFIGFSRLFEDGHYLTDLLAGYGLGIAWGALVYTILEAIGRRRRA